MYCHKEAQILPALLLSTMFVRAGTLKLCQGHHFKSGCGKCLKYKIQWMVKQMIGKLGVLKAIYYWKL